MNRIPIIVIGDDTLAVDDFISELSDLMHFRKEIIYYTDFISEEEYQNLCSNEELDYNSDRIIIRCPTNVTVKALKKFNNLKSWLIGFEIPNHDLQRVPYIIQLMSENNSCFLKISLIETPVSIELVGSKLKLFDLKMEKNIIKKVSRDTENSIVRMKRILTQKKLKDKVDGDTLNSLLDFSIEKEEIQKNIFKREIQNFFSASKRAFFILNRLKLLSTLGFNSSISGKTLLDTVDYEETSVERILSFINYEWGEEFDTQMKIGKNSDRGDKLEMLWG